MTKAEFSFNPMAKAFAYNGDRDSAFELESPTKMSLTAGFPPIYSKPLAAGGRLIQRKELNLLFYQLTLFQNFIQNGGTITWDRNVMTAIGGYPNGAILSIVDSKSGIETRVQSMTDNNYLQPTSDSIGEKYKVKPSNPPVYTKDEGGDVMWRYVKPYDFYTKPIEPIGVNGNYFDVGKGSTNWNVLDNGTQHITTAKGEWVKIGVTTKNCQCVIHCDTADPAGGAGTIWFRLSKDNQSLEMPLITEVNESASKFNISLNLVSGTKLEVCDKRGKQKIWTYCVELYNDKQVTS